MTDLDLATWRTCNGCGRHYSAGLDACPWCGTSGAVQVRAYVRPASERDEMQARAETAPPVKPAATPLRFVVERAYAQEGRGLTPAEVMRLAAAVRAALSGDPVA